MVMSTMSLPNQWKGYGSLTVITSLCVWIHCNLTISCPVITEHDIMYKRSHRFVGTLIRCYHSATDRNGVSHTQKVFHINIVITLRIIPMKKSGKYLPSVKAETASPRQNKCTIEAISLISPRMFHTLIDSVWHVIIWESTHLTKMTENGIV